MRARIEPSGVGRSGRTSLHTPSEIVASRSDHESGSINRKTALNVLVYALSLCCVMTSTASADPVSLLLPQSIAFAMLDHSCGGIQERAYATGFDATSGYPVGDVYISDTLRRKRAWRRLS